MFLIAYTNILNVNILLIIPHPASSANRGVAGQ